MLSFGELLIALLIVATFSGVPAVLFYLVGRRVQRLWRYLFGPPTA